MYFRISNIVNCESTRSIDKKLSRKLCFSVKRKHIKLFRDMHDWGGGGGVNVSVPCKDGYHFLNFSNQLFANHALSSQRACPTLSYNIHSSTDESSSDTRLPKT